MTLLLSSLRLEWAQDRFSEANKPPRHVLTIVIAYIKSKVNSTQKPPFLAVFVSNPYENFSFLLLWFYGLTTSKIWFPVKLLRNHGASPPLAGRRAASIFSKRKLR
ncbi:MAG: hypothetical protein HY435_00810 [Candidatus Liptonbacteria bacterium]|nr:hypothetical protein [Candidatus Liptonbacteria bacterium]